MRIRRTLDLSSFLGWSSRPIIIALVSCIVILPACGDDPPTTASGMGLIEEIAKSLQENGLGCENLDVQDLTGDSSTEPPAVGGSVPGFAPIARGDCIIGDPPPATGKGLASTIFVFEEESVSPPGVTPVPVPGIVYGDNWQIWVFAPEAVAAVREAVGGRIATGGSGEPDGCTTTTTPDGRIVRTCSPPG